LAALESRLFEMYNICHAVCGRDEAREELTLPDAPLVLADWVSRDRGPKVPKVTVPEIHDALCLQAAQQRRGGGELEEEEEDTGEEAKREAEKNRSPFQRVKVSRA
jgi:hypothetical protein